MQKRITMILTCLLLLSISATAQVKVGYFSYEGALKSMPDYAVMQKDMQQLEEQYAAELKYAETEFNSKYEEFLENYDTFAPSIRQKRQNELTGILESNIAFRNESQRLLADAKAKAIKPLEAKLNAVISEVGRKFGYILLLNNDNNAAPYIDSAIGEDVNALIIEAIK